MNEKRRSGKAGYTLMEGIISLAVAGILITMLTVNIVRIAKQAYLGRANDSAEVVYMALQSAVTDLKTQGRFDEVFSDEYLGEFDSTTTTSPDAKFYSVPDKVLDGVSSLNLSGITNVLGGPVSAEELQKLKDDKSLVYMVLNRNDDPSVMHPDSQLLRELLDPYIADKSILNYSILAEVNRNNKTVRAVFYSEKTPEIKYSATIPDESMKKNRADAYFRDRNMLDDKDQGYYGTLSVGDLEDIQKLDNAYVKLYNDDMLVVEWGEFAPAGTGTWETKKNIFPGMTYDIYLVNAVDTSKKYYKIEGVTPYESQDQYGMATKIPIYDLYSWNEVSKGVKKDLAVDSFKTYRYDVDGKPVELAGADTIAHRFSYIPGTDANQTPGLFRLVLDSVTEAGHDSLSVAEVYPELPWNENFKVIVEGRYQGEGFTGSMNLSQEVANAYTESKSLHTQGKIVTADARGVNTFTEFVNYIKERLIKNGSSPTEDFWWYGVSYARHLNNIRYIINENDIRDEYNNLAENSKQGKYQNFMITDDIDWSLQKIGRTENANPDDSIAHRVTVANTTSEDLQDKTPERLKVFVPLSVLAAGETLSGTASDGFAGVLRSDIQSLGNGNRIETKQVTIDGKQVQLFEPYRIRGLKLAKDDGTGTNRVNADPDAEYIGLFEAVSAQGELSHLILSGITGVGGESVGSLSGRFYGNAEDITALNDMENRSLTDAVKDSNGVWKDQDPGRIIMKPWDYGDSSAFRGNLLSGKSYVGGLFGILEEDAKLLDIANGTVFSNQYALDSKPLNGIAVKTDADYAGGIAGAAQDNVSLIKVVNTGEIRGSRYVGGIAGTITDDVRLDGSEPNHADGKYLLERHNKTSNSFVSAEFQNYGTIIAEIKGTGIGSYAGGIVGSARGVDNILKDRKPILSNLRNAGSVLAENSEVNGGSYAGGIAGSIAIADIYNVQNAADIHAEGNYAGGIVGEAAEKVKIDGAQNLAAEKKGDTYLSVDDANGVEIFKSSVLGSGLPAGVSAKAYAGGIAGILNKNAQLNALTYKPGPDTVTNAFLPYTESSSGSGIKLVLNRSLAKDLINSADDEFVPLFNNAQVTAAVYNNSDVADAKCIGGIAGSVIENSGINAYSEDTAMGWTVKVPVKNIGDITAKSGRYIGGIVGAAAGNATVLNVQNGQSTDRNTIQGKSHVGGIAGAVSSEKDLRIGGGNATAKQVRLQNSEQLAWSKGSSVGTVTAENYDTNRARLVIASNDVAGGIVGLIDVEDDHTSYQISNIYNGGSVRAGKQAGGLFGAASGKTTTKYDIETLTARMVRGSDFYATNSGEVYAGSMAGGISGSVESSDVKLRNVFNTGKVTTVKSNLDIASASITTPGITPEGRVEADIDIEAGDCAGGIIGFVMVENPGVAGEDGVLRHDNSVIRDIVMSSDNAGQKPSYTNRGAVTAAGSYAGGIIGKGSVSLVDVFNAAEVTAMDSYAGGIIGQLGYATTRGVQLSLSTTTIGTGSSVDVVGQMLAYVTNGYGSDYRLYQNSGNVSTRMGSAAGGIAGAVHQYEENAIAAADQILVENMYNAGHVVAGRVASDWSFISDTSLFEKKETSVSTTGDHSISAGGIIGEAKGVLLSYDTESINSVIDGQTGMLTKEKLLPNMGNILAWHEAGGLIGSAAGTPGDELSILVVNGLNRGVVRTEYESAGGVVGEGIWTTVRTEKEVAAHMLAAGQDQTRTAFSNQGVVIAGSNNAGGIAGKLENSQVKDTFNRGEIYAGMDNAGGVIGYARMSDPNFTMKVEHSRETAGLMFADTDQDRYTFTNTASVEAGRNNAGGIAGKAVGSVGTRGGFFVDLDVDKNVGKIAFLDVYSGDTTTKDVSPTNGITITAANNAGGMVGRFVDSVIRNDQTQDTVLEAGIYTNNAIVTARENNAGGIVGNADARGDQDTKSYSTDPKSMKADVDSNHYQISNVYNIGTVTARSGFNAGGIFGVTGAGSYQNDPDLVAMAVNKGDMLTNKGAIEARNNAGGIFGAVTAKLDTNEVYAASNVNDKAVIKNSLFGSTYQTEADVLDVFNGGDVTAKNGYNAGGIAGSAIHLDLRYSEDTLKESVKATGSNASYEQSFLASNTGTVKAGRDGSGGIIGRGYECILQDVFNTGYSGSFIKARDEDLANRIIAGGSNAGGIIGQADGLKLFYSDMIADLIRGNRNYVYSNVANVRANGSNAGGIVGYARNSIEIVDAYNMGAVTVGSSNVGGLVGYLEQKTASDRDGTSAKIVTEDPNDPLSAIKVSENTTVIRSDDPTLRKDGKALYRGEDFITFDQSVSYLSYTTISTGMGDEYKLKRDDNGTLVDANDSFGNPIYTNRYTSMAKPAIKKGYGYQIVADSSRAGGIVGFASATDVRSNGTTGSTERIMAASEPILRIENVFSAGNPADPNIGGVWAKQNDAGGIIGTSEYAHLTYSFDINPGPDGLDVGGTGNGDSKGDHSVMTEAFNDPRVMKDPYAIGGVALHMVANSARVRASGYGPDHIYGNSSPDSITGSFLTNYRNAGGAIGSMSGGRAERIYSLKGEVTTPNNLGGVVGYSTGYALVKQVSRMGNYNKTKMEALEAENQYDIYSYPAKADLDGVDILAGTVTADGSAQTVVKTRGSLSVGGIVGFADNGTWVMDTRNLVNVEGRAYVGGIVGQAGKNVEITLAHNMQKVTGKVNSPEDDAHKGNLSTPGTMNRDYLDRSVVDGAYIGGIVGKTYDTAGYGTNPTVITMAKNDPLLTQYFEEYLTEKPEGAQTGRWKAPNGGNSINAIDGRKYVGGITGAHGVINYALNTGWLSGVQYIGGISGQGYRITNSFNIANVDAINNYVYLEYAARPGSSQATFMQATYIGGIAGQLGHRNNDKVQKVESGSFIKNAYNSASRIRGASIVGGIAGYAVSPIDTTYNSANIMTMQSNLGNDGSEPLEQGNKSGGLVGLIAQDREADIVIVDSYSSGVIRGTGDVGGILGAVEYFGDGEILNSVDQRKRIKNCYYIKDDSVRCYDPFDGQLFSDINATLRPIRQTPDGPIEPFTGETNPSRTMATPSTAVIDSEYGARAYSNMIFNGYTEYKNLLMNTVGGSGASGLTGVQDLQTPLNDGSTVPDATAPKAFDWQQTERPDGSGDILLQQSQTDRGKMGPAKFVFPYSNGSDQDKIKIGRDYEFMHLDFSGSSALQEDGVGGLKLDPKTQELPDSNQWFVSTDNTVPSNLFNIWPTKVIDYMKVDVSYNDGGSTEDTVYGNNGTTLVQGTKKNQLAQQMNPDLGIPLWQVNYSYAGMDGRGNNHVPTSVFTPETMTFTGRFTGQEENSLYKLPRIMKFKIYDGYSRGDYSYDSSKFTVKMVENQIQKTYNMVREDEWNSIINNSSGGTPPVGTYKTIQFQQPGGTVENFYFYIEGNTSGDDSGGNTAVNIMDGIKVDFRDPADGTGELEWKITIPSIEMDTYLAAKSGFFTAEAVKVYDEADNIRKDNYSVVDRTSRMFNLHFSSYNSSKDPNNANYLDPTLSTATSSDAAYRRNKGIFEYLPVDFDLDKVFETGNITMEINDTGDTAALGSVKLKLAGPTDIGQQTGEYFEYVINRLQIANERHLYNFNKNQNQGTVQIDSYLPYVNRDLQLIRDVQLSTDNDGYNCFIIGLSKGSFNRMSGSLDGMDLSGNIHTIGNLQVDMEKSNNLPSDLEKESYGLIYDLSGGVVKNLQIGSDSRIRAEKVGALAFQTSNGKWSTDALNNPWYENLEPELRMDRGVDAKIYNTRINADISGAEVGGFVYQTVRRFESSGESRNRDPVNALTITNSVFGGTINAAKANTEEDRYLGNSLISAGFLCRMLGNYDDNNLLDSNASGRYPQNAYINGSEVDKDAYIYGKEYSAGIMGAVDNLGQAQIALVQKSANNGAVVSTKRASGISQGIMDDQGIMIGGSGVDVRYSYSNGIVQTPETTGLASGIGNNIRRAEYSVNNGTVIGRIASGISSFGAEKMEIVQCSNNGYVQGYQIAGGIVAALARYDTARGKAMPFRLNGFSLNLSNCYNTGTVVVTTNIDNNRENGTANGEIDAIHNSYAGGIIGMAVLYDRDVDWFKTNYNLSDIARDDKRKTVLRNCYNAGRVYFEDADRFSLNHRYLGGIAGGGLHRFTDIQNCYNLSDAEAEAGNPATMYYLSRVNLDGSYQNRVTDRSKTMIIPVLPATDTAYNYNLTAVGDMPYGRNVTNMSFSDMLNLENFVGFNNDRNGDGNPDIIWTVDHLAESENGYVYPFPQFIIRPDQVGELFVGDDYQAEAAVPDAVFNVNINKEKFHTDVTEIAEAIRIDPVTDKDLVKAAIGYREEKRIENLGAFDKIDATQSNANPVSIITKSQYTINLNGNTNDYEVYVYDGDSDATNYAPALIRRYEVSGNAVTSGGKLHDEQSTLEHTMQYFNTAPGGADYATGSSNSLTIGDKEEVGWYMPINGFYTVVVAKRGQSVPTAVPEDYNDRVTVLAKGAATRGGIPAASTANSSERFQVHFSGDSIESRRGTYESGSKNKPYKVTDQYSILGMTTSGIAQESTDRRYYKQINDILITEHAYPMFMFSGVYDGARPVSPSGEPVMNGNYTISYRTGNGDFGFINYLSPTKEAREDNFVPTISNLNILAAANGTYSSELGRYYEAANYTTALGLVTDYAEYSKIEGVTTLGDVVYGDADTISYRQGYYGDKTAAMGGVAGIIKNSTIRNTKNNATLGVRLTPRKSTVDGIDVSYTQHPTPNKGVRLAGIAAVAIGRGNNSGVMEYVFNNGELRATAYQDAAGIADKVTGVNIRYAANGGWIRAMNGTAAGLVHTTDSDLKDSYNSGLVSAGSVKGLASGNAVGLFWSANSGRVDRLYNAGVVRGNKQGAITRGTNVTALAGKAYYLKDEELYWMDSSSLPDDMKVTDEKQVELYLGFSYVPVESYAFTEDEVAIKNAAASGRPGIYDNGDPYAVNYAELTNRTTMVGKGFDFMNTWTIKTPAKSPEIDQTFIRQYKDDDYPLPQFRDYPHLTRRHLGFPVFLGGSKDVAKVPYENAEEVVKYIPFDYGAGDRDETFKDTIAVDLNDFSTTAKYRVLVYDGKPRMSKDSEGKMQCDEPPRLDISIQRRYIDTRDMTFATSTSGIIPAAVGNDLNKEYGELFSNERGAYFYEVNAFDPTGTERAAVFQVKEFLSDNRVELLFNNDILDGLAEPGTSTGAGANTDPYYSVTIVESQVPIKNEDTDWNNYYSKFNPHFANATAKQSDIWTYGSIIRPFEIATQRNLYNIAKGKDSTAYLGNHYKQTQDIQLSAKKADAGIANRAPNSIGVSQYLTAGADPTQMRATVMKSQDSRSTLWSTSIGKFVAGTTENGFRGIYTASKGTAANPDEITGGYKLLDTRTAINASIFGRVSPNAKISDVSYELAPARQTSAGSAELSQNSVSVAKDVKALLVEENMGTVDNVIFANEDTTKKTIQLTTGAKNFALVVGGTSKDTVGISPPTPEVTRIAVKNGYDIKVADTTVLTFGSIVGQISGPANLSNLKSAVSLNITDSRERADTIGMLVGEIKAPNTADKLVMISDASMTGSLNVSVATNKSMGGLVGKITDADVSMSGVTVGNQTSGAPVAEMKVTSAARASALGGLVGAVNGGSTTVVDAKNHLNITLNGATEGSAGGLIGKSEGAAISLTDITVGSINKVNGRPETKMSVTAPYNSSLSTSVLGGLVGSVNGESITVKNADSYLDIVLNNVNRSSAGGMVGKITDAKADLDAINIGITDQNTGASVTQLTATTLGSTEVGGLVGSVSGESITVTNAKSYLDIALKDAVEGSAGGLIGKSEGAAISLTDITVGSINKVNGRPETKMSVTAPYNSSLSTSVLGGLVGSVNGESITVKNADSYLDIVLNNANRSSAGGMVGKITDAKADLDAINIGSTDQNTGASVTQLTATTLRNTEVGGLVGSVSGESITVTNAKSYLDIALKDAVEGSAGGMIGKSEHAEVELNGIIMGSIEKAGAPATKLTANFAGTSTLGGLVGSVSGEHIAVTNAKNYLDITVSNTGRNNSGGLIGESKDANVTLDDITVGGIDDISGMPITQIIANSAGNSTLGGLVGSVSGISTVMQNPGNYLNISNTKNYLNITLNGAKGDSAGGLVGNITDADVSLNEITVGSLNKATGMPVTYIMANMARDTSLGGLVGSVNGRSAVQNPNNYVGIRNAESYLDISMTGSERGVTGGIVGKTTNADVLLNGNTVGSLDQMTGTPVVTMDMSKYTTAPILGGLVGSVSGGRAVVEDTRSYLFIDLLETKGDIAGGMIGKLDGTEAIIATASNAAYPTASASNASIVLKSSGEGTSVLGGIIGQIEGSSSVGLNGISTGNQQGTYGIHMQASGNNAGDKYAGGIVGKVVGRDAVVEMAEVTNRLEIQVENSNTGLSNDYLGGLIGYSDGSTLYLQDKDPTENSSLVNEGQIKVSHKSSQGNQIYAAGGIGYLKNSPSTIFAFRNNGNVEVAADDIYPDYSASNVYIAGVLAYAEGDLKGVAKDDMTGNLRITDALSVSETLNTGNIMDQRTVKSITESLGSSYAGGIIATLEGGADAAQNASSHPVQVVYNHTVGEVKGQNAAGILTKLSDAWVNEIHKEEDSDSYETPVELKWNISRSPIDAGYKDEDETRFITGDGITLVYELPMATVDGEESDGFELAEVLESIRNATPSNASPSNASPSDATPSDATPSDATPSIKYYNVQQEGMVKSTDVGLAIMPPTDRVSSAVLSLAQLQSLEEFREATLWNEVALIDDDALLTGVDPPKWVMKEGVGPGVTENRYIPPGILRLKMPTPKLTAIERKPMEFALSTWGLRMVSIQTSDDDEEFRADVDLIDETDGSDGASAATPSNATPSNAAKVMYKLVETVETMEADGFELTWEYTEPDPEALETVADSDMEQTEVPEYEFAVVWSTRGMVVYQTETGALAPGPDGTYHFTVTPDMVAKAVETISFGGEYDLEMSIAVKKDGRFYRGLGETVRIKPQYSGNESAERMAISWAVQEDLADYSEAAQHVVNYGMSRMGDRYSQALAGYEDYVDCSYFVMDSYEKLGIGLPRTAAAQAQYLESAGLTVPDGNLMPGDLIFYSFTQNGRYKDISHVAMYVGNGMIVDASSSKGEVVYRGMFGLDSVVTFARPLAIIGAEY